MFANERRAIIIDRLNANGTVTVSELMELFGVSIETIRRDMSYLESTGQIIRVHGGATTRQEKPLFPPIHERIGKNRELKLKAAEAAADFIHEKDVIAIDAGTTAMAMVEVIKKRFNELTVLTHSIDVFNALADATSFKLFLAGGAYMRSEHAFHGNDTETHIAALNVKSAFVFPSSVTPSGVGVSIFELIGVMRAYIKNASNVFIVFDSTKTGHDAPYRLCGLSVRHKYVTDNSILRERELELNDVGINIIKYKP